MANKSIIFMLDTSGSMYHNGRYYALMDAMKKICEDVLPNVNSPRDIDLNTRILCFGGEVSWVHGNVDSGVPINEISWSDITAKLPKPNGPTPLGSAIDEVCKTLYRDGSLVDPDQIPPAICLICDGEPNDDYERSYRNAIEMKLETEQQGLFARSKRVAIGIGSDYDPDILQRFINIPKGIEDQNQNDYYHIRISDDKLDSLFLILSELILPSARYTTEV